jgi:hypothetical protein
MNADPSKKIHPDAKLKLLPEERQAEIADFAAAQTLGETVLWLTQSGVEVGIATLSRFLSWYRLKLQVSRNESAIRMLLEDIIPRDPAPSAARLFELSLAFFTASAIEHQDLRSWYLAQQIALQNTRIQLEAEKYHDLVEAQKAAAQREKAAADGEGGITPETLKKIEHELNLC